MLKKLSKEESLIIYQGDIIRDFQEPYPFYQDYKTAIENEIYHAYLYYENGEKKAYIIIQELDNFIFIPWYAVLPDKRGKGIGSNCLKELQNTIGKEKIILLETENEKNASNEKELSIIKRRIQFYQKLGFLKIEYIQYELNKEFYDLMVWGSQKITAIQAEEMMLHFYSKVLKNLAPLKIEIQEEGK